MKMKYSVAILAVVVWMSTTVAKAQFYSLSVAESTELRSEGYFDVTAGAVFGNDTTYAGVRDTFNVVDNLRLFVDVGAISLEGESTDIAAQGGALVCLPIEEVPVDIGIRGAIYGSNGDSYDTLGCNLLMLASKEAFYQNLFFYGGVGLDYRTVNHDISATSEEKDRQTNLMIALGALMPITERLYAYAEITVVEDPFIGFGLRFR